MEKDLRNLVNSIVLFTGKKFDYNGHKISLEQAEYGRDLVIDATTTPIRTNSLDELIEQVTNKIQECI